MVNMPMYCDSEYYTMVIHVTVLVFEALITRKPKEPQSCCFPPP